MNEREHVGEYASLYALGALVDDVRHAVDAHAAACDDCARLLGQAESDVALLAGAQKQHAAPSELGDRVARAFERGAIPAPPQRVRPAAWIYAGAAIAAVAVFGVLPSAYLFEQNRAMHDTMLAEADAMSRLANTSLRSARFEGMSGDSSARVMYAPDGSWYVVLARGVSKTLQLAWMHDGERTMLGPVRMRGNMAMLYLPRSHRMDRLALVDGERVVAEAQLGY